MHIVNSVQNYHEGKLWLNGMLFNARIRESLRVKIHLAVRHLRILLSQYLVNPLANTTALKHFSILRGVILFLYDEFSCTLHFSYLGHLVCTACWRSIHRFLMMFHSGDCDGHSKSYSLYFLKWQMDFEVCFGSLPCCKSHSIFSLSFFTDCVTFTSRNCCYLLKSIFHCTCSIFSLPLAFFLFTFVVRLQVSFWWPVSCRACVCRQFCTVEVIMCRNSYFW